MNVTTINCSGCGACFHICPVGAIVMEPREGGGLYPRIREDRCIRCGLCEKVCAYRKAVPERTLGQTWVAAAGDVPLDESASGGLGASLARKVIEQEGVVFGCAMTREAGTLSARHLEVSDPGELIRLKGSKYVQSDLADAYPRARARLEEGKTLLFTGTPCQIAGLKGYLGRNYDNLYTAELICHGVPSAAFFRDYLAFVEKREGAKVTDFRFRDKSRGWQLMGAMELTHPDGRRETRIFQPEESSYYQLFLNGHTYRENCYHCPYASQNRQGDVTLGDYWCIDLVHPELLAENPGKLREEKGVSCLVVNNPRGRELVEKFGGGVHLWPSDYEKAARYNGQLLHPAALKPERQKVMELYAREGYEAVDAWYQKRLRAIRRKRRLIGLIPQGLKDLVRPLRSRWKEMK